MVAIFIFEGVHFLKKNRDPENMKFCENYFAAFKSLFSQIQRCDISQIKQIFFFFFYFIHLFKRSIHTRIQGKFEDDISISYDDNISISCVFLKICKHVSRLGRLVLILHKINMMNMSMKCPSMVLFLYEMFMYELAFYEMYQLL